MAQKKSAKSASSVASSSGAASKSSKQKVTRVNRLEQLKSVQMREDIPVFRSGDKVVVRSKIKEGDKERVQAFEGVVIARNGRGIAETITVRRVTAGVGIERVYPLHSPLISEIEVKVRGFVRRGKLYYLRDRDGKSARIQDRSLRLQTAHSSSESGNA
jgi:large subunit ribosomal protein L19